MDPRVFVTWVAAGRAAVSRWRPFSYNRYRP